MQNFSTSHVTGTGAVAGTLALAIDWAARRNPADPSGPNARANADADADPADTRPLVRIDAHIAGMLGIDRTPQRARRDAATTQAPVFGTAPHLLARPLEEAREWLARNQTRIHLAAQNLTPALVDKYLRRNVERFLQGHPARTWNGTAEGQVTLPQLPTAHDLFVYSVFDAQSAQLLRDMQATTPTAATTTTTTTFTTPATPATPTTALATVPTAAVAAATSSTTTTTTTASAGPLMVNGYYVESQEGDIRNRDQAMAAVVHFRHNVRSYLPQFGAPTHDGFIGLEIGRVAIRTIEEAVRIVPCAATVHGNRATGYSVTYPQGQGGTARLQSLSVNGQQVLIARGENPNRVVYSLDGIHWKKTGIYTDDTVEAAKVAAWDGVTEASKKAYAQYRRSSRWMKWLK